MKIRTALDEAAEAPEAPEDTGSPLQPLAASVREAAARLVQLRQLNQELAVKVRERKIEPIKRRTGQNRPKLAQIGPKGSLQMSETGPTGQNQAGMQSAPAPMSCGTGSRRYRCSSPRPRQKAMH